MRGTRLVKLAAVLCCLLLSDGRIFAQGLVVDQASGNINEIITQGVNIPDFGSFAQSFTPSLSAVGFVQFQTFILAGSSGETVVINLRQDAYNGPIVSSTTPVFMINKGTETGTFYFSSNIPVTPNQVYYFEPVVLSAGSVNLGYKDSSTYVRGEPWINGVQSGPGDFWFREGVVVPEPSAVILLGLGIVFYSLWHQRLERRS
jgi:PEP-CTERM motif